MRVVARAPVVPTVESRIAPTPATRAPAAAAPSGPRGGRVYQINQGVSNETYGGLLCAPDANKGGWNRLREMQPGDVILHNVRARIVAVSVVEPMDIDDPRLVAVRSSIRRPRAAIGACLPYEGDHLTVPGRPETDFLVCLISTVLRDQALATAVTYSGYAVGVRPDRLAERPDLVRVVGMAHAAAASLVEDDE
ncbi:MAG: hypothetical protein U0869_07815 [Chloroflexota bacterium]